MGREEGRDWERKRGVSEGGREGGREREGEKVERRVKTREEGRREGEWEEGRREANKGEKVHVFILDPFPTRSGWPPFARAGPPCESCRSGRAQC